MKASELKKNEKTIEDLYKKFKLLKDSGEYKFQIIPPVYISTQTIDKLLNDGFKCYQVKYWSGLTIWMIEW